MCLETVARKEHFGLPVDVRAFGGLLLMMLRVVIPGKDDKDLYRWICRGQFEVTKGIAAAPRALINRMMSIEPS